MIFSDEFVASVKDDPINGFLKIFAKVNASDIHDGSGNWNDNAPLIFTEAFALVTVLIDLNLLNVDTTAPELSGGDYQDSNAIYNFLVNVNAEISAQASKMRIEALQKRFEVSLSDAFSYEFSQGDLARVQQLINELREQISASNLFEADHQRRLLMRLEKLQSEMHKKVSDLDRFWGLIGDAGVALGKFGKDAKPIIDRMIEISNIVWRTQARAEELPSGAQFPLLGQKNDADSET